MEIKRMKINNIPVVLWGKDTRMGIVAVHGNMSNKEDEVIRILAEKVVSRGYQLISFDLPEHGERKDDKTYLCNPQNCINDIKTIMEYANIIYDFVSLWACSMGAYFSMLAFDEEGVFDQTLFLSPIIDMKSVIDNMMRMSNVTEEELEEKKEIKTEFGPVLYWDYYEYVKNHPIKNIPPYVFALYGDKDNMQEEEMVRRIAEENSWVLTVLENGEHYFHTEEQLEFYKKWLDEVLSY